MCVCVCVCCWGVSVCCVCPIVCVCVSFCRAQTNQTLHHHHVLHSPGNILVNVKDDGTPHLTLLDCGLVIEFGPEQHATVVKILGAFARRDGILAGQLMVDNDSRNQASKLDCELFIKGIQQICFDDEDQVSFFSCLLSCVWYAVSLVTYMSTCVCLCASTRMCSF